MWSFIHLGNDENGLCIHQPQSANTNCHVTDPTTSGCDALGRGHELTKTLELPSLLLWKLMTQKGKKSSMSAVHEYSWKRMLFMEATSSLPHCPTKGQQQWWWLQTSQLALEMYQHLYLQTWNVNTAPARTSSRKQEVRPAYSQQVSVSHRHISHSWIKAWAMSSCLDVHSACQNASVSRGHH